MAISTVTFAANASTTTKCNVLRDKLNEVIAAYNTTTGTVIPLLDNRVRLLEHPVVVPPPSPPPPVVVPPVPGSSGIVIVVTALQEELLGDIPAGQSAILRGPTRDFDVVKS